MARTSSLTPEQQAEVKAFVDSNSEIMGRNVIGNAAKHFDLTPAKIRGCLPKEKKEKKAKAEPAKVNAPKKARKEIESETEKLCRLIKEHKSSRQETDRLWNEIRKIVNG
jgi:hypothetical protein